MVLVVLLVQIVLLVLLVVLLVVLMESHIRTQMRSRYLAEAPSEVRARPSGLMPPQMAETHEIPLHLGR